MRMTAIDYMTLPLSETFDFLLSIFSARFVGRTRAFASYLHNFATTLSERHRNTKKEPG